MSSNDITVKINNPMRHSTYITFHSTVERVTPVAKTVFWNICSKVSLEFNNCTK